MIAVDTNILVRLLVKDPDSQKQVDLAKALLKRARRIYIAKIVQIETVWVLESAYGFDKAAVITALKHLQHTSLFVLEQAARFNVALGFFENHSADFSDYLILSGCLDSKHELFTFDKKFARLHSVNLLDEKQ